MDEEVRPRGALEEDNLGEPVEGSHGSVSGEVQYVIVHSCRDNQALQVIFYIVMFKAQELHSCREV
jgi:hypothetical protein